MNVIPVAEKRGSAANTLRRLYWDTALSWKTPNLLFFFQAEDGIRDHCVTGVQTCGLPILVTDLAKVPTGSWAQYSMTVGTMPPMTMRSEERRVGKECRSRWAPYH